MRPPRCRCEFAPFGWVCTRPPRGGAPEPRHSPYARVGSPARTRCERPENQGCRRRPSTWAIGPGLGIDTSVWPGPGRGILRPGRHRSTAGTDDRRTAVRDGPGSVNDHDQRLARTFVAAAGPLGGRFDLPTFLAGLATRCGELFDAADVGVLVDAAPDRGRGRNPRRSSRHPGARFGASASWRSTTTTGPPSTPAGAGMPSSASTSRRRPGGPPSRPRRAPRASRRCTRFRCAKASR